MIEEEFIEEEEEIQRPSILARIAKGVIVLLILWGFIYLSGFSQYFLYQRTSPEVQQESVTSVINEKEILVPLSIFIIQNDEENGSKRTKENVRDLVQKASQIWEQANIELEIRNIQEIEKSDKEIALLLDAIGVFLSGIEEYDRSSINVFLAEKLRGINGLAFGGFLSIAVADYTTVYDFRALAHEVGHILGLRHVQNVQQLMHQGANGFKLSIEEILRARESALRF